MSEKKPHVCEPTDQSKGRSATFIFLHGYADDGEGLPLALAQQFQFNSKLPYLRWVLPNAPIHPDARERAWYLPKALPNSMKPRVPGVDEADEMEPDDEEGIIKSVAYVDDLVKGEIDRGVDPTRIIVGGFSQGCAISLVWGLTGKMRDSVAGVVPCSGYFPLADRIGGLREAAASEKEVNNKKWLLGHGSRDILVPKRLFEHEKQELKKWVNEEDVEDHIYEGMGHSTCNAQLRDMLRWFDKVVPP